MIGIELASNAFLTKGEIRNYIFSLDETNITDETVLLRIANSICSAIESHCKKYFIIREGIQEVHDGGHADIFLRHYPVVEVTEIKENDTTVTSEGYFLYKDSGILSRAFGVWYPGRQKVEITYKAGYGTQVIEKDEDENDVLVGFVNVPEDVRLAGLSWIRSVWKAEPENFSAQLQSGMMFTPQRIPPEVAGILEPYRGGPSV